MMDFANTLHGRRLLEHTLPSLVREMGRLATTLQQLGDVLSRGLHISIHIRVQPREDL